MMKFSHYFALLPLALGSMAAVAETATNEAKESGSVFHFSTQVSRTVDKDLMEATVYSRKIGKSLPPLKKQVAANLNSVVESAKKYPSIEVQADGISNYANYNSKGKVDGWVTEGYVYLKSKDFEAMANVIENLGEEVAISGISFSISPEKVVELEDELTLEIIKQFQHKAELIQKQLGTKEYVLSNVQLQTPNGRGDHYAEPRQYLMAEAASMSPKSAPEIPLEAGKATLSAQASGKVTFK